MLNLYLESDVATDLLRTVREHGPEGSTKLGTVLAPDASGRPAWTGASRALPLMLRTTRFNEPLLGRPAGPAGSLTN